MIAQSKSSPAPQPPGPRSGLLLGGPAWRLMHDPLDELTVIARNYGDIARLPIGHHTVYVLNHPDFIRSVLVENSGVWGRVDLPEAGFPFGVSLAMKGELNQCKRTLIQTAFQPDRVLQSSETVIWQALRFSQGWQDGQEIDLAGACRGLCLRIIAGCLLGTVPEPSLAELIPIFENASTCYSRPYLPLSLQPPAWRFLTRVRGTHRAVQTAEEALQALIAGQIGRASGPALLSLMLNNNPQSIKSSALDGGQLQNVIANLFFAAYEKLASVLAWSLILMGDHPEVQEAVQAELDLSLHGSRPKPADAERWVYLPRVVSETLRLYPPVWIIMRRANADVNVGGYRIPCGATVWISQWLLHRDPRFFPDPQCFNPARWTDEPAQLRPSFAFFPFGGGPHGCIGETLARLVATLVLAVFLQHWSFRLLPGQTLAPQPGLTLRPPKTAKAVINSRILC